MRHYSETRRSWPPVPANSNGLSLSTRYAPRDDYPRLSTRLWIRLFGKSRGSPADRLYMRITTSKLPPLLGSPLNVHWQTETKLSLLMKLSPVETTSKLTLLRRLRKPKGK